MHSTDSVELSPVNGRPEAAPRASAWVELFMPRRFERPGDAASHRIAVELGLLLCVVSAAYALVQPFGGSFGAVVRALCWGGALVTLLGLMLAKRMRHFGVSAQLVLGYFALSNGTISYYTGGPTASSLYWLAVFPVAALLLCGRRSSRSWLLISAGIFGAFLYLDRTGHAFPLEGTQAQRAGLWLINTSSFVVLMMTQIAGFDRARSLALRGLRAVNAALRIAREAGESASERRTTFLTNISHELRTPMASILGYTEMLIERCDRDGAEQDRNDVSTLIEMRRHGHALLHTLDLILARAKSEADCLPQHARASEDVAPASLAGCRVLVIDDSPDNLRLVRHFLQREGARITCCESGARGLEAVAKARQAQQPFDVILLDIQMPVMDGHEVARRLREDAFQGAVVAFTAHAMGTERERCLRSGFDDYATKPIDRAALVALIARHAESTRARATPPITAPPSASDDVMSSYTRWQRLVSWCLPCEKRTDPSELRRLSLLLSIAIATLPVVLALLFLLWHVFPPEIGRWLTLFLLAMLPLEAAVILAYRWFGSTPIAALILGSGVWFNVAAVTYFSGGTQAMSAFWCVMLPMVGVPLAGRRWSSIWTSVCVATFAGFYLASQFGVEPPNRILPDLHSIANVCGALVLMLNMTALMSAYEYGRSDAVRTLAAASQWLSDARAHVSQAEQASARFLGSISVDLRSPLVDIQSAGDALYARWERSDARPEDLEQLAAVGRSARSLLSLIDDLLDMSRLHGGRLELETAAFVPADLLRDTIEPLRERARSLGLTLDIVIDATAPGRAVGDARRLARVLDGLLQNAIRFTDNGGIRAELGTSTCDGERWLSFAIRDTGCGIASEDLPRIFAPFRQIDGTAARRHGGSGLGLALARGLVEAMGGTLDVMSVPSRGSTFTVRIPLSEPALDPPRLPTPSCDGHRPESAPLRRRRILVCEASEEQRRRLAQRLDAEGASAEIARDVDAAADKAIQAVCIGEPYDAVLIGNDSTEAVEAAAGRMRAGGHTALIIARCTGASTGADCCTGAGCDLVLTHSSDAASVIEALRQLCEASKSGE